MQRSKTFFDVIKFFFLALALWQLTAFSLKSYQFYSHYREVRPSKWSYFLTKTALNKVVVGADYTYTWAGQSYTGSRILKKQTFLNHIVATEWIEREEKTVKTIYVNPAKPANALLERNFPWKAGIQLILVGVGALYFAYLRSYVSKYS